MAREARLDRKPARPRKKKIGFTPGKSGFCEAQLWEFTGPAQSLLEGEDVPLKRIAALSLEDALKFIRRRYPDFAITKAAATGIIVMLAGSPFD